MNTDEHTIITNFIARVSGATAANQGGFAAGSVPATVPALPPVDREADTLIGQLFAQYPEARYRITQLAFVQEHALAEAQNRIQRLEWELQQTQQALAEAQQVAQQAAQQAQQAAAQRGGGGGFLGGIFGGGARPAVPPPQQQPGPVWNQSAPPQQPQYQQAPPQYAPPPPQYAPGYQPGMFQRPGSGFLGSALTTAAGVAGGMVVGNALMGLFSPHQSMGMGMGGGMFGGGAGMPVGQNPWAGAPPAQPAQNYVDQGAVDQGTWDTSTGGGGTNNDWNNTQDAGWTDPGSASDSGDWGGGGGGDWGGGGSDDV
jgi:hypothetical protein